MDWMEQEQERGITITSAATPASAADNPHQHHRHARATWTSRPKSSARCASSTARSRCSTRSPASSRSPRPSGGRPTSTGSRASARQQDGPHRGGLQAHFDQIITKLEANPVAIQLPIGSEDKFVGVVDLIRMKSITYKDETMGADYNRRRDSGRPDGRREALPRAADRESQRSRRQILEKYLQRRRPTEDEIKAALRKRVNRSVRGKGEAAFVPVICGSAFKNKGVQPLLDAVVDFLPSPLDVPAIIGLDPNKKEETFIERPASDEAPFAALAFKIMTDPFVGQLTFFRVYSGVLKSGPQRLQRDQAAHERIGRLLKMHANKREEIKEVYAGDIAAAVGMKSVSTGDTMCDENHAIVLESMDFPKPVISLAIEAEDARPIRRSSASACRS